VGRSGSRSRRRQQQHGPFAAALEIGERCGVEPGRSTIFGVASRDIPIACSLGTVAYAERMLWIARLNRDGLRRHRRDGLRLELSYAPHVSQRVHELVEMESACCAFLDINIEESAEGVHVTITAPERARDSVEDLFAPFLP
jgi:hypothetical protein